MAVSLPNSQIQIVIPAKAGIHFSTARAVARWIPAYAGMTKQKPAGLLRGRRQGLLRRGGGAVGLEEGADVAQRELDLLGVRLPRIDADLRVGREVGGL